MNNSMQLIFVIYKAIYLTDTDGIYYNSIINIMHKCINKYIGIYYNSINLIINMRQRIFFYIVLLVLMFQITNLISVNNIIDNDKTLLDISSALQRKLEWLTRNYGTMNTWLTRFAIQSICENNLCVTD